MSVEETAPPRPGRRLTWRALLASVVIVLTSATGIGAIGLLQIDELQDVFSDAADGRSLDLP